MLLISSIGIEFKGKTALLGETWEKQHIWDDIINNKTVPKNHLYSLPGAEIMSLAQISSNSLAHPPDFLRNPYFGKSDFDLPFSTAARITCRFPLFTYLILSDFDLSLYFHCLQHFRSKHYGMGVV